MPDRPEITRGSGDIFRPEKEEPKSRVALFAANTATIVSSSFAQPSASTAVPLRALDDENLGVPRPVQLSKFYRRLLVGLIVFGALCVVVIVILAFFVAPEQTQAQKEAVGLLIHLVSAIIGLVLGLFTGKQL
jgi:hypothetical protein